MNKSWCFLMACIFAFGMNVKAQKFSFDPKLDIDNISISQWTSEDGLSSNNVTSVFQDSEDLIWITSFNGFMIYDGERFDVYDKNTLDFLDTDGFYSVTESPTGEIYLASQGSGVVKYSKGKFELLEYTGEQVPKSIRCLHISPNNDILIGTNNNGLYRIRNGVSEKIRGNSDLGKITVVSIVEGEEGFIWVATEGKGFYGVKGDHLVSMNSSQGLLSNIVTSLVNTKDGKLLIGTENGLQLLEDNFKLTTIKSLEGTYINNLLIDEWNSVWIGTEKGLARWNIDLNKLDWLYKKKDIDLVRISSMMKDHEGNIWLTSNRVGLVQIKESQVTNLTAPTLSSDRVYVVHESWDGQYYIGTDKNEINICDELSCRTLTLSIDLKGNGIRDIYRDTDGTIWLATYIGIIHLVDGEEILYSAESGMPSNQFRTILKDKRDFFWFGSKSGGLVKFKDGEILKIFANGSGLESNFVLAVSEGRDGDIYVGTHSGGMTIIDSLDVPTNFNVKEDDSGLLLFNIDVNEDGTALVTSNVGPFYFDKTEMKKVRLKSDFRSKTYFDAIDDQLGNIWITTNIGVLRIKKKDWNLFIKGKIEEIPHSMLDDNQGMSNKECTGATKSTLNSKGHLLIPTLGGVCIIDTENLVEVSREPKVLLRHFYSDNTEVNLFEENSSVSAGSMRFNFQFSVLSYAASERNQYTYKLYGFDKNWSSSGYTGQVEYTNLPPGKYTFRVKGSNETGVWSRYGDDFSFTIESFYYQTIWFYLLVFLIVTLILLAVYKWRVSFISRKNIELKKVNAELDRFVYSASHELRSPLSSILGLINVAKGDPSTDKTEYFDYIEKSVKRLDLFIHDIIDHSRNSRQKLQLDEIDLSTMINEVIKDISYMDHFDEINYKVISDENMYFRHDEKRLKIVLSNLITNAFKHHAPEEKDNPFVNISMKFIDSSLVIEIEDNGPGIDKKHQEKIYEMFYRATTRTDGTGLGLYIVAEIVETMKGKIKMQSESGVGTKFTLTLPSSNK
ncbi:MAG: GHKL domain-containing protein [Reichenbachiella sp.]